MKYSVDTITTAKKFDEFNDAEAYFNFLIDCGYNYVELKEIVSDFPHSYYTKSVKIYYK